MTKIPDRSQRPSRAGQRDRATRWLRRHPCELESTRRVGFLAALGFGLLVTCVVAGTSGCERKEDKPLEETAASIDTRRGPDAGSSAVDQAELDRLRALGYVEVVDLPPDALAKRGVLTRDEAQMEAGLTFFTNALDCSAILIDATGELQHEWRTTPCLKWENSVLLSNGDIITIHWNPTEDDEADQILAARELMRVSWDGSILWRHFLPVHHDLDVLPDGRILTAIYENRVVPRFHSEIPLRDHLLLMANAEGHEQARASITDLLASNPSVFEFQTVAPRERAGLTEIDLIHANSIEWMRNDALAQRDPIYAIGNVLVSIRHQDVVAIFDWEARRVVWSWGQGVLSGPHDATLLDSGNILVFDNGLARKWSRVLEIDPSSDEIVWNYTAPKRREFFSATRGAAQRLAGGNTLITESSKGRVFEVTPSGEVVWDFLNPHLNEEGKALVIVRARRVKTLAGGANRFLRSD